MGKEYLMSARELESAKPLKGKSLHTSIMETRVYLIVKKNVKRVMTALVFRFQFMAIAYFGFNRILLVEVTSGALQSVTSSNQHARVPVWLMAFVVLTRRLQLTELVAITGRLMMRARAVVLKTMS